MSGLAGRGRGDLLIEGRNNLLIWLKDQTNKTSSPKVPSAGTSSGCCWQHHSAQPVCGWLTGSLLVPSPQQCSSQPGDKNKPCLASAASDTSR